MGLIPLKIAFEKATEHAKLPTKGSEEAAGLDLYAAETLYIRPGKTAVVSTGLKMVLPRGYEAQVRPRSGLAARYSVTVLNSPGTIDSDYRGVIGVVLINHSECVYLVEEGDRIAQMVVQPCITQNISCVEVHSVEDSARGESGFGSTGR